jgi:hypothetical protein
MKTLSHFRQFENIAQPFRCRSRLDKNILSYLLCWNTIHFIRVQALPQRKPYINRWRAMEALERPGLSCRFGGLKTYWLWSINIAGGPICQHAWQKKPLK